MNRGCAIVAFAKQDMLPDSSLYPFPNTHLRHCPGLILSIILLLTNLPCTVSNLSNRKASRCPLGALVTSCSATIREIKHPFITKRFQSTESWRHIAMLHLAGFYVEKWLIFQQDHLVYRHLPVWGYQSLCSSVVPAFSLHLFHRPGNWTLVTHHWGCSLPGFHYLLLKYDKKTDDCVLQSNVFGCNVITLQKKEIKYIEEQRHLVSWRLWNTCIVSWKYNYMMRPQKICNLPVRSSSRAILGHHKFILVARPETVPENENKTKINQYGNPLSDHQSIVFCNFKLSNQVLGSINFSIHF